MGPHSAGDHSPVTIVSNCEMWSLFQALQVDQVTEQPDLPQIKKLAVFKIKSLEVE